MTARTCDINAAISTAQARAEAAEQARTAQDARVQKARELIRFTGHRPSSGYMIRAGLAVLAGITWIIASIFVADHFLSDLTALPAVGVGVVMVGPGAAAIIYSCYLVELAVLADKSRAKVAALLANGCADDAVTELLLRSQRGDVDLHQAADIILGRDGGDDLMRDAILDR